MNRSPTIEWQTNGVCNYDCTYCIQSKKFRTGQPDMDEIEAFLRFFHTLPDAWEIKMSGGEPFASKAFMTRIIPGLMETQHSVSVLTNLSAPLGILERFAALTRGRLKVVSASLHLEYTSPEEFIPKAVAFASMLEPSTSLVINSVVVPGTVARLLEVRRTVEAAGLRFFPQLMKTKHGVVDYSADERLLVEQLIGKKPTAREANVSPSYRGRTCWSGVDYFVLSQTGDAYSCRTAKRFGEGYLGNVFDGSLKLLTTSRRCTYDICPCTVPVHRGIIELEA